MLALTLNIARPHWSAASHVICPSCAVIGADVIMCPGCCGGREGEGRLMTVAVKTAKTPS